MYAIPNKYKSIFKKDALGIAQDVIEFAELISNDKYRSNMSSKVYSISAGFGIGKSFFCEKLNEVLQKNNVNSVIFNVWKSDFYEDPFIPILAELNKLYQNANPDSAPLPDKIIKKRSWAKILSNGIKLSGRINLKTVGEISGEIDGQKMVEECNRQDGLNTEQDDSIYKEYKEYEQALSELKSTIEKWLKSRRKPAVIIIDELDRCRPDYAVKTLEVIKHFFDISGLVFVLAIDEEQLENSVKCLFGTTDFDGYKRKFISNSFKLPEPDNLKFAEMLYEKSGIEFYIQKHRQNHTEVLIPSTCEKYTKPDNSYPYQIIASSLNVAAAAFFGQRIIRPTSKEVVTRYFASFADKSWCNFSLRKQEQVFDRIVLFTKSLKTNYWFCPELVVFLACLHEQLLNPRLFSSFQDRITNFRIPNDTFFNILDSLMGTKSSVSSGIWKQGWESTLDIRKGMLYSLQRCPYPNAERSQQKHEPVSTDKLDLYFDIKNNNTRMDLLGYENFDTSDLLKTYFSKMEFVSRFSENSIKDTEMKKDSNFQKSSNGYL